MSQKVDFICETGFCPRCGSILPSPSSGQTINCIVCNNQISIDGYVGIETKSTVVFNVLHLENVKKVRDDSKEIKGPLVSISRAVVK